MTFEEAGEQEERAGELGEPRREGEAGEAGSEGGEGGGEGRGEGEGEREEGAGTTEPREGEEEQMGERGKEVGEPWGLNPPFPRASVSRSIREIRLEKSKK